MRNKLTKITLAAGIALAMAFTFGCSSSSDNGGNEPGGTSSSGAINSGNGSSSSVTGGTSSSSSGATNSGNGSSSSVTGGISSSSSLNSSSSSRQYNVVYGTPVTYGEETYKTVIIGTQTWFQRNLNYAVEGSKCYGEGSQIYTPTEIQANCDKYGRLYSWATAMALPSKCDTALSTSYAECAIATPNHRGICPSGWHIPSDADWNVLMKIANPSCLGTEICERAGAKLKATSGWYDCKEPGNGTDDFGFAALPGGEGNSLGEILGLGNSGFGDVGSYGEWWSTTEYTPGGRSSSLFISWKIGCDPNAKRQYREPGFRLKSIRCVKD